MASLKDAIFGFAYNVILIYNKTALGERQLKNCIDKRRQS